MASPLSIFRQKFFFTAKYVFVFSSAYAVYQAFCRQSNTLEANFCLFLLVAFVAAAFAGRRFTGRFPRFTFLGYPWRVAVSCLISALLFILGFGLVLSAVSRTNAVTVLVILTLQPVLQTLGGAVLFEEERQRIKSGSFLALGFLVSVFGILLYRNVLRPN